METWQTVSIILGVLVTWSAVQIKAFDWMLNRQFKQLDAKWESTEKRIEKLEKSIAEVRRDYVKREDWMRLSTTVEAKLDVVSARLDAILLSPVDYAMLTDSTRYPSQPSHCTCSEAIDGAGRVAQRRASAQCSRQRRTLHRLGAARAPDFLERPGS